MTSDLTRGIPSNFIRNAGFERGNLDFWHTTGAWINTSIVKEGSACSPFIFRGFMTVGDAHLIQNDYIPVKAHEHVQLTAEFRPDHYMIAIVRITEFNASRQIVRSHFRYKHISSHTTTRVRCNATLSADAHYIRGDFIARSTIGGLIHISCTECRISDRTLITNGIERIVNHVFQGFPSVPPSGSIFHDITVPEGVMARLLSIDLYVARPPGSTAGDHNFEIFSPSEPKSFHVIARHTHASSTGIRYWSCFPFTNQLNVFPPNPEVFKSNLKDIRISYLEPLRIQYRNFTNVTQSNVRTIRIKLILERIYGNNTIL